MQVLQFFIYGRSNIDIFQQVKCIVLSLILEKLPSVKLSYDITNDKFDLWLTNYCSPTSTLTNSWSVFIPTLTEANWERGIQEFELFLSHSVCLDSITRDHCNIKPILWIGKSGNITLRTYSECSQTGCIKTYQFSLSVEYTKVINCSWNFSWLLFSVPEWSVSRHWRWSGRRVLLIDHHS